MKNCLTCRFAGRSLSLTNDIDMRLCEHPFFSRARPALVPGTARQAWFYVSRGKVFYGRDERGEYHGEIKNCRTWAKDMVSK